MIILNYFPTHCNIAGFIAVARSTIETPILVINVAIISGEIYIIIITLLCVVCGDIKDIFYGSDTVKKYVRVTTCHVDTICFVYLYFISK